MPVARPPRLRLHWKQHVKALGSAVSSTAVPDGSPGTQDRSDNGRPLLVHASRTQLRACRTCSRRVPMWQNASQASLSRGSTGSGDPALPAWCLLHPAEGSGSPSPAATFPPHGIHMHATVVRLSSAVQSAGGTHALRPQRSNNRNGTSPPSPPLPYRLRTAGLLPRFTSLPPSSISSPASPPIANRRYGFARLRTTANARKAAPIPSATKPAQSVASPSLAAPTRIAFAGSER